MKNNNRAPAIPTATNSVDRYGSASTSSSGRHKISAAGSRKGLPGCDPTSMSQPPSLDFQKDSTSFGHTPNTTSLRRPDIATESTNQAMMAVTNIHSLSSGSVGNDKVHDNDLLGLQSGGIRISEFHVPSHATQLHEDASPGKRPHNFCTNCGSKFDVGHKFCGNCGSRLPSLESHDTGTGSFNSSHESQLYDSASSGPDSLVNETAPTNTSLFPGLGTGNPPASGTGLGENNLDVISLGDRFGSLTFDGATSGRPALGGFNGFSIGAGNDITGKESHPLLVTHSVIIIGKCPIKTECTRLYG